MVLLQQKYDLIYVFADCPVTIHLGSPVLVDKKIVYSAKTESLNTIDSNIIEYKQGKVSKQILDLALASGVYSRFRKDTHLPVGSYEKLYTRWIEQSVNHVIATEVFCYMLNDTPRGLITLKREAGEGIIGLVATDEGYRGRGIGKTMMAYVMDYALKCACSIIHVTTQSDNRPACRLYESAGLQITQTTDIWHWWLA